MAQKTSQQNTTNIAQFTAKIHDLLKASSSSWLAIADELSEADNRLNKDENADLLEALKFSYSTGRKLIKVARSDRIKRHKAQLKLIDSWSVLHEVTKLTDIEFEQFRQKHLIAQAPAVFSRSDVQAFKVNTKADKPEETPLLVKIKLKVDTISSEAELDSLLKDVKAIGSNQSIQLEFTDLEETLREQLSSKSTSTNIFHSKRVANKAKRKRNKQPVKKGHQL